MPEFLSPPGTEIVSPYLQRRHRYKPKVGDKLTIELPGERTRAEIKGVTSDDIVLVELLSVPVSKAGHSFVKGGLYPAERELGDHDIEVWKAISEFELQQKERQAQYQAEQEAVMQKADDERIAEIRERDLTAQAKAAENPQAPTSPKLSGKSGEDTGTHRALGPRRNKVSRSE